MRKLITTLALALGLAFAIPAAFADTLNSSTTGGEFSGLRNTVKQYHLTTSTTTVVSAVDSRLYGVTVGAVTTPGTTWTLTITDGQATAANFISAFPIVATTIPTFYPVPQPGILMKSGIKITTAGTPGVLDIWVVYR